MTRKSRSRSSQCATPLPAAVQALRKTNNTQTPPTSGKSNVATVCRQANKETSEKQCGVCEICKIEYDTLTIHLKTKDHEYFAKNAQNFIALDTLIQNTANVNKFLTNEVNGDDDESVVKSEELEEMEVEHTDVAADAIDPLEDAELETTVTHRRINNQIATPSPPLRERSKRSTKGKHSSEKFQNNKRITASKSKSSSPLKMVGTRHQNNSNNNSKINSSPKTTVIKATTPPNCISINENATTTTRKQKKVNLSSPVRAILPPSSLYKVVGTPEVTPRRGRNGNVNTVADENVTASPSLIVKFKKVRQAELLRLNGEAASFMFSKKTQRSSSDLPTDIDRSSSSDGIRDSNCSYSSLESSYANETNEPTTIEETTTTITTNSIKVVNKRNIVKGGVKSKQSFRSAPIQPNTQLKPVRKVAKQRQQTTNTLADLSPPSAAAAIVAATAKISLPTATRKSSRTATAIVSAATTSSRLLRAAAEVVKKSTTSTTAAGNCATPVNETSQDCVAERASGKFLKRRQRVEEMSEKPMAWSEGSRTVRRCRLTAIVKMEDRMGDSEERTTTKTRTIYKDDDDEDDDDDDDDDDDETIKIEAKSEKTVVMKRPYRKRALKVEPPDITPMRKLCRRLTRGGNLLSLEKQETEEVTKEVTEQKVEQESTTTSIKEEELPSPPRREYKKKSRPLFDFKQSEHLQGLRFAFERVPASDLWYRVFSRQDACEERYFEYYGDTQYRKLPYELGPIPAYHTQIGNHYCKICNTTTKTQETPTKKIQTNEETTVLKEAAVSESTSDNTTKKTTTIVPETSYAVKHKKLHLLQRYRQEQEALKQQQEKQQKQKIEEVATASKANSTEREVQQQRERAGSTSSSCASSTATSGATLNSAGGIVKKSYRNKHLNRAAFLSLEMPPRKSPREHASTLALVSIIKQQQESKPNSDTEDIRSTAATPVVAEAVKEEVVKTDQQQQHNARLSAATPVEEMRFTTEISENVKRMRRGRNKYDHSPPYVLNSNRRIARLKLKQQKLEEERREKERLEQEIEMAKEKERKEQAEAAAAAAAAEALAKCDDVLEKPTTSSMPADEKEKSISPKIRRRKSKFKILNNSVFKAASRLHSKVSFNVKKLSQTTAAKNVPTIRKTGQKKNVLEFEMDALALQQLDEALLPRPNVRQLERQIDKFLLESNKIDELEMNLDAVDMLTDEKETAAVDELLVETKSKSVEVNTNTPPATDYFSSDFDLCDLLATDVKQRLAEDDANGDGTEKLENISGFKSLNKYFRKRKYMKTNRTGWPKIHKKKYAIRNKSSNLFNRKVSLEENKTNVITPPDSEPDSESLQALSTIKTKNLPDKSEVKTVQTETKDNADAVDDDDIEMVNDEVDGDVGPSIFEEDTETVEYSVEEESKDEKEEDCEKLILNDKVDAVQNKEIDSKKLVEEKNVEDDTALEADDEDDCIDAEEEDVDTCTQNKNLQSDNEMEVDNYDDFEPKSKNLRRKNSLGKALENCFNSLSPTQPISEEDEEDEGEKEEEEEDIHSMSATTSTPSTHMLRGFRTTPQLNGSLLSCHSPSEKAGDNSDIFTVSSDGLDTDLDLSNPHANSRSKSVEASPTQQMAAAVAANSKKPKKKYDISKYVPNPAANTCAAEVATAAAKSLAIAQFLKKEVRVTCRRIRAPFRRFRYRR